MIKELLKMRSREKEAYVIALLEQQVLLDGVRSRMERRRGVFHPSEISGDFCPREWLLCDRNRDLYLEKKIPVNTQLRWDVGTALHDMVQEKLGSAGVLFGQWECLRHCFRSGCTSFGFAPSKECRVGNEQGVKPLWVFRELRVRDEELEIEGRTDGLLDIRGGKYVFEFKSMNDDGFSTLVEPLKQHKEQGAWYLDVLERRNWEMEKVFTDLTTLGLELEREIEFVRRPFAGVVFLYLNKDSQRMREFKIVGRRGSVTGEGDKVFQVVQEKRGVLKTTLQHREAGTLPERLCRTKTDRRAKRCLARNSCFEEE